MAARRIVIRADAGPGIGLGHVTRCLALGQAFQGEHTLTFVTRTELPQIQAEIRALATLELLPPEVPLAAEPAWLVARLAAGDVVVLDGYQFSSSYEAALQAGGLRVVSIDDLHDRRFCADLIINHAGGVRPDDYEAAAQTRFALGPAYALLRPDFLLAARAGALISAEARGSLTPSDVLICLGGADPHNDVLRVTERALARFPRARLHVVLGAGYQFGEAFEAFARTWDARVSVHRNLTAAAMADLMRTCGAAVLPPSGVGYEYACVRGLLLVHSIADNQRYLQKFLIEGGFAFAFDGPPPPAAAIAGAIARQCAIFDGRSGERLRRLFDALMAPQSAQPG